jgi:hypothetical protein
VLVNESDLGTLAQTMQSLKQSVARTLALRAERIGEITQFEDVRKAVAGKE